MPSQRLPVALLAAFALSAGTGAARAETIASATTEYTNRIKVGETIQPLAETPFGENVSLYTGNLSFRQTDISVPGIGPAITLTRTYEVTGSPTSYSADLAMGDWDLAVPQISAMVPGNRAGYVGAWSVNDPAAPSARCSRMTMVSQAPFAFGLPWWHGYQLISGDGSSQPLLKRTAENALAPGGNVAAYPVVTPNAWQLACLSATSNQMPGEAFLAVAPDGTRYWFDHLAYGAAHETLIEIIPWLNDPDDPIPRPGASAETSMVASSDDGGAETNVFNGVDILYMPRKTGHLFATRVEDRFGNWVAYRYTGTQLQEITASDGRHVLVSWRADAPLIDRISVQPGTVQERIWKYSYDQPTNPAARRLVMVLQPDNSSWQFDTAWAAKVKVPPADPDNLCGVRTFTQISADDNIAGIAMTHPTGLQAIFGLSLRARARSWVPTSCTYSQGAVNPPSEHLPAVYLSLALTSKTFSGPGVSPRTWSYRYSPARGSIESECLAAPCQDWQWVEVTDPENQTAHYRFSTRWGYMEGKLLAKVEGVFQTGTDNPAGLETETYSYADPLGGWTFPARIGKAMQDEISYSNNEPTERMSPETLREKQLQGVRFIRETSSFDRFGNPETVRRASLPGDSRTETTSYWPVDAQWVVGQPWKTTQNSRVISQTDYDGRILPQRTYSFGLLQATYGYAANGMLASITDPRNNVTTLADHKRGVPQTIRFADATVVAPTIDDFGQVASVRNQLGDSTNYRYDSMGRLTHSSFPVGDSVAWNPVNRSFGRIGLAQYGLPWGHWKQEVRTGNALTTTLFDALWRPRLIISEDVVDPGSRSYVVKRYDADGREIYSSYPVSTAPTVDDELAGVRTSYDALGRIVTVSQDSELGVLTTRRDYLSGYRTRVTNARGHATTTSFQTFDEPSEESPVRIEAPAGVMTVIQRDVFGKPLTITRSGPVN